MASLNVEAFPLLCSLRSVTSSPKKNITPSPKRKRNKAVLILDGAKYQR